MNAKEWRRRINLCYQAAQSGRPESLQTLCEELAALTAPKEVPAPATAMFPEFKLSAPFQMELTSDA